VAPAGSIAGGGGLPLVRRACAKRGGCAAEFWWGCSRAPVRVGRRRGASRGGRSRPGGTPFSCV